jgi:hypothetical protein
MNLNPGLILFSSLLIFASMPAGAEKPDSSGARNPNVSAGVQGNSANGTVHRSEVARDPSSQQIEIRPGPGIPLQALSRREQNMLSRSDEGLEVTVLPSGAVSVNLQGRFQSMATARMDSGHHLQSMTCSIGDDTDSAGDPKPESH